MLLGAGRKVNFAFPGMLVALTRKGLRVHAVTSVVTECRNRALGPLCLMALTSVNAGICVNVFFLMGSKPPWFYHLHA